METQYYYNRYSEYPSKVYCPPWETQGKENRWSWHNCTEERAKKRFKVACETEQFYHHVAIVTENETDVTVREAFVDDDWQGFVTISLNKKGIFGDQDKAYRDRFALSIFADAMGSCVEMATAC